MESPRAEGHQARMPRVSVSAADHTHTCFVTLPSYTNPVSLSSINSTMLNCSLKPTKNLPTHTDLIQFVLSILPLHPHDVPPIYHEPRYPGYHPASTVIHDVVLSITPTQGVYSTLFRQSSLNRLVKPACFLHRPFNLDRKGMPRGSLVLASHKRFDELLTVGWNVALAETLGLEVGTAICVQGYKGDPTRRIGLIGGLLEHRSLGDLHDLIMKEFATGDIFPTDIEHDRNSPISGVAIMNAFGPDEVVRVVDAATGAGLIGEGDHAKLLYITGEPKEQGLATLTQRYDGMIAMCVGHRAAEEWGIRHLSARIKKEWNDVDTHVIFEEEEDIRKETDARRVNPAKSRHPTPKRADQTVRDCVTKSSAEAHK